MEGVGSTIAAEEVSKDFGAVEVLRRVTLPVYEREVVCIIGPSGSGKTTLLRMIAGFQQPTGGEILMRGKPVRAVPPHNRAIGMVFQRLALFPHMSAAENVSFPLKMRRFDARAIPERVRRYLEIVRLGGLGARRVHELSGGQQQRVAIARALVFEPDLLLLDEPLASLDRKLREEMQIEFRRIQRELGVTTINVTHDQREALVMSDEIIVMDKGRIQQKARPAETYREPANPFVAGFIGVTNFFSGTIASGRGDAVALIVGGVELPGRAVAGGAPPRAGAPAKAALRAEQIRIAASVTELGGLDTIHEGRIADVIFEGERIVYEAQIGSLGEQAVRAFSHDPARLGQFEPGSRVFLGWNSRDLLVYSDDTATRSEGE